MNKEPDEQAGCRREQDAERQTSGRAKPVFGTKIPSVAVNDVKGFRRGLVCVFVHAKNSFLFAASCCLKTTLSNEIV
jgi:hypothetical protein